MKKLQVKPEGRPDIWIPTKDSLKAFIKARKLKTIHNFIPSGMMMLGADHDVKSVLYDIDRADRLAVFTDPTANIAHALALIFDNKLEMYDIGKITEEDLDISLDTKDKNKHCNQCGKELKGVYSAEMTWYCVNPECPNYALQQIPLEEMPKQEEK